MKKEKIWLGKNVTVHPQATLHDGVVVESGSIIEKGATLYPGVHLGPRSFVAQNCILGERLRNYYPSPKTYKFPRCIIGKNALLRAGTIIYGGTKIGDYFETGPYVTVRESSIIGSHSRIGNGSDIQGFCRIGNYVCAHSHVTVCQNSTIEDFVWLHPYANLLNDWYPPTCVTGMEGPRIERYAVIGANAVIFPGIRIGRHAVVGAMSLVRRHVSDYQLVAGNPAQKIRDVRDIRTKAGGKVVSPYPWKQHRKLNHSWATKK